MSDGMKHIQEVRELENYLLRSDVRGSHEELDRLLADDFYEVGTSGRLFDKTDIIDALVSETPRTLVMQEFIATSLSESVVLTTFRIIRHISDEETRSSRHSSVWRKTEDGWEMFYHQGTLEPVK